MGGIKTKTLFLSSLDDPVIPACCIPTDVPKWNENVIMATLPFGGHANFYIGNRPQSLNEGICTEFLTNLDKSI